MNKILNKKELMGSKEPIAMVISVNPKTQEVASTMFYGDTAGPEASDFKKDVECDFPEYFTNVKENKASRKIWVKNMFNYDIK